MKEESKVINKIDESVMSENNKNVDPFGFWIIIVKIIFINKKWPITLKS